MIKTGEISPGTTPDTEHRLPQEKAAKADKQQAVRDLDDDFSKRAADTAAKKLATK